MVLLAPLLLHCWERTREGLGSAACPSFLWECCFTTRWEQAGPPLYLTSPTFLHSTVLCCTDFTSYLSPLTSCLLPLCLFACTCTFLCFCLCLQTRGSEKAAPPKRRKQWDSSTAPKKGGCRKQHHQKRGRGTTTSIHFTSLHSWRYSWLLLLLLLLLVLLDFTLVWFNLIQLHFRTEAEEERDKNSTTQKKDEAKQHHRKGAWRTTTTLPCMLGVMLALRTKHLRLSKTQSAKCHVRCQCFIQTMDNHRMTTVLYVNICK